MAKSPLLCGTKQRQSVAIQHAGVSNFDVITRQSRVMARLGRAVTSIFSIPQLYPRYCCFDKFYLFVVSKPVIKEENHVKVFSHESSGMAGNRTSLSRKFFGAFFVKRLKSDSFQPDRDFFFLTLELFDATDFSIDMMA
jgi:hypothetical protein